MLDVSLKIANYRSFDGSFQGFDSIPNVTVIVGRNNAGKSALIEAVSLMLKPVGLPVERGDAPPTLHISRHVDGAEVARILHGQAELPSQLDRARFTWSVNLGPKYHEGHATFVSCLRRDGYKMTLAKEHSKEMIARLSKKTLDGYSLARIAAERDVKPESRGEIDELAPNGDNATRLLFNFANTASFPRQRIERDFLEGLNRIFEPDCHFDSLWVRDLGSDEWELFLREEKKGDVPLSRSGSGIKTVVLVLCHLILWPIAAKQDLKTRIFAFEELENNLHPAVLRRLLAFIREVASKQQTHFFLTTHSAATIDAFANDPYAQILHVTHDGDRSLVAKVNTYVSTRGALSDLGVRASDLLQANGVIWVEGPSDLIYVKRWIEVASDGKLREGTHYQCVFYGGRLLARLDAVPPGQREPADSVSVLRVNGHAAVLIDSDKGHLDDDINDTKKRIVNEIEAVGGVAWVTKGREIENYLAPACVARLLELPEAPTMDPFEKFGDYLNRLKPGAGDEFKDDKPTFAARMVPLLDRESLDVLDLKERVEELLTRIRAWNSS